jgi:hypothetical protein
MSIHATGANFEIQITANLAECRVWKRRDLSREEGARCGDEMTSQMADLARGPQTRALGFMFDLRQAPPAGPLTQRSIEKMLAIFEAEKRRVAIVAGDDPLAQMQLRRMTQEQAPKFSMVFLDIAEARIWAQGS